MSRPTSFKQNAVALYAVQGLQYLSPLLVLPILTRELGSEGFGKLAFWQAFIAGLGLLIEYGFNYSAVRVISNVEPRSTELGKIYRATLSARALLLIPSALLLILLPIYLAPKSVDPVMQSLGLIALAGIAGSPNWYLAGLKRNAPLAYASTIPVIIVVVFTWLFVRGRDSLHIAAAIQFIAPAITAITAQCLVYCYERPMPANIRMDDIYKTLRQGMPAFLIASSAGIYSALNPFLLGLVTSPVEVGYFSLGERLARAGRNLLSPMMATLFPYASIQAKTAQMDSLLRNVKRWSLITSSAVTAGLALAAPWVVPALSGEAFTPSVGVTQILAFTIFLLTASNLVGVQHLIANGHDKSVLGITMISAPVHILAILILGQLYGAIGAAIAYTLTEAFVTVGFQSAAKSVRKSE